MTQHTESVTESVAARRFEGVVLVLILLMVGGFAGAASFTHVHDWTMDNSPAGTGDWFGWANAVVSELVPIASLLVMRRRKRAGQPVLYPAFLLVLALGFSVSAQLAVAKPGFTGGLVAVVPALAFAALAKLVLGKTPAAQVQAAVVHPVAVTEREPGTSAQEGPSTELVVPQQAGPSNGHRDTTGLVGIVTR